MTSLTVTTAAFRKILAGFLLLCAILPAQARAQAVDPEAAATYVESLAEQVIQTLGMHGTGEARPSAQHLRAMQTMLEENLDLTRIIRIMAGDRWQQMNPAQQERFSRLTHDYITLKYAFFLSGYQGESFRISGSQRAGSRDALVATSLSRNGQPWAQVEWRVTGSAERLYILDVKIEGISLIRTEQSQMQSILQQEGIEKLLDSLDTQVTQLREKADSSAAP